MIDGKIDNKVYDVSDESICNFCNDKVGCCMSGLGIVESCFLFEAIPDPIKYLTMGAAIEYMRDGLKVARKNWNGKGMNVHLVSPSKFGHTQFTDFLEITSVDATKTPWAASQTDILAEDWYVVEDV